MTDNIRPDHYRTGEIDLFEEWYLTYPFEQYRAIMQSHAEKYLRRNKVDRVEDLGKAMETIRRLREKEIEHADRYSHVKTKYGELLEKGTVATEWTPAPEEVLGQADFRTLEEEIENDDGYEEIITKDGTILYKKDSDEIQDKDIYLLNLLLERGYRYLARDKDEKLWAYDAQPIKLTLMWTGVGDRWGERLGGSDYFPEVKWTDDEPTKISELLASYENGGENGKVDGE